MESTPKSRSVGIAHFYKCISIAIWLNSLEYQFRGRDIMSFSRKVNLKPTHSTVVKQNLYNFLTRPVKCDLRKLKNVEMNHWPVFQNLKDDNCQKFSVRMICTLYGGHFECMQIKSHKFRQ